MSSRLIEAVNKALAAMPCVGHRGALRVARRRPADACVRAPRPLLPRELQGRRGLFQLLLPYLCLPAAVGLSACGRCTQYQDPKLRTHRACARCTHGGAPHAVRPRGGARRTVRSRAHRACAHCRARAGARVEGRVAGASGSAVPEKCFATQIPSLPLLNSPAPAALPALARSRRCAWARACARAGGARVAGARKAARASGAGRPRRRGACAGAAALGCARASARGRRGAARK